ncbi:hypothetical protein D1007_19764 [Hordeum vulgare]|nr:hypothetical protein D1007_19764 [Hordeum vulgare]
MFLTRRWKSFARSRWIVPGHLLHYWFNGSTTLYLKFFGASGVCLGCCVETSSGSNVDTSNRSGDDRNVFVVKQEGDDSK